MMNELLRLHYVEFNGIVNRKIKRLLDDKTINVEQKFKHMITLSVCLSLTMGIETTLTLCDVLKTELPKDVSDTYRKRMNDFVDIIGDMEF